MSCAKHPLLLAAELVVWTVFAFLVFLSAICFDTARQAPELWGYLAPDRLEDVQFKWIAAGVVWAIAALPALGGGIGLHGFRRRGREGWPQMYQTDRDRQGVKRLLPIIGCGLCWLVTAFLAFLVWAAASWLLELLPNVVNYGYDEAAGYNLHLAEDFWEARIFMVLAGVPFLFMLALAIHLTIKLRKRGKQRGHSMPDKW